MTKQNLRVCSAGELVARPLPDKREDLAQQLVQAAEMLRQGVVVESVAWRLADTAADFVTLVEAEGGRDVQGVHGYSGKGGKLVRRAKP